MKEELLHEPGLEERAEEVRARLRQDACVAARVQRGDEGVRVGTRRRPQVAITSVAAGTVPRRRAAPSSVVRTSAPLARSGWPRSTRREPVATTTSGWGGFPRRRRRSANAAA